MPSPFPGMDPWLEHPSGWQDVHNSLAAYLRDELNAVLGSGYVARVEERVVVEKESVPPRGVYPDVTIVGRGTHHVRRRGMAHDDPVVVTVAGAEYREAFVEVRDRLGTLVTAIELLSPSNKALGGATRGRYRRKQGQTLRTTANLVEIDLLRAGEWTVACPESEARAQGKFDNVVCVSRPRDRDDFELYTVPLPKRLPRIGVPLTGRDPDVAVDLQRLVGHCYDAGRYAEVLDYTRHPVPLLDDAQAEWADAVLRRAGLRKKARRG